MGSHPAADAELELRLENIFRDIFLLDAAAEVCAMSSENTPTWDSVAQFSLVIAIEDAFGIPIPAEDDEKLQSFAATLAYIRQATADLPS